MVSHHQDREVPQVSPVKEVGFPGPSFPHTPGAPCRQREERESEAPGSRDRTSQEPTLPAGAADSHSDATQAAAHARSWAQVRAAPASDQTPRVPLPGCWAASTSQGPDRRPRLLSRVPNPPRTVPEGAAPPLLHCAGCGGGGGGGHSFERSDASHKNNNLLPGVCSREAAARGAPQRMLGLVVWPVPYIWRQRRAELRLPKRSAACRLETAGSWAKQLRASQHPGPGAGEAETRRGRLLWRRASTITRKDSRFHPGGLSRYYADYTYWLNRRFISLLLNWW